MAFLLIDTVDLLHLALTKLASNLRDSTILYCDIEGQNLGRNGTLDLLQLYALSLEQAFVFDVFALGEAVFLTTMNSISLKSILESNVIIKVFFDVRNDSDALFKHFGIQLQGVVDLQLMEYYQPGRYGTYLLGLQACIERDCALPADAMEIWRSEKSAMHARFDETRGDAQSLFQKRPLPDELIKYSANDVMHLPALYRAYRVPLRHRLWQMVETQSRARIEDSQRPEYNPQDRNKRKGPRRNRNRSRRGQPLNRLFGDLTLARPERQEEVFETSIVVPSRNIKPDSGRGTEPLRYQPVTFVKAEDPKLKKNENKKKKASNVGQGATPAMETYHEDLDWALCDKDCGWCGHCYN
ncbi:hypothetical protein LTS08_003458 [Lithohypha guttulata]|nr:hypothetical protein LTS08_003458 [Lithohypha guttulata]